MVAENTQDGMTTKCAEGVMTVEKAELKHIFANPSLGSRTLSVGERLTAMTWAYCLVSVTTVTALWFFEAPRIMAGPPARNRVGTVAKQSQYHRM